MGLVKKLTPWLSGAFLLFVVIGCVTQGDLQDLATDWAEEQEIQRQTIEESSAAIAELFARTDLSEEERQRRFLELAKQRDEALLASWERKFEDVKETAQTVADRTKNVFNVPLTGNPLADLLSVLGATGILTGVGVNKVRDTRRVARGEPAGKPTA